MAETCRRRKKCTYCKQCCKIFSRTVVDQYPLKNHKKIIWNLKYFRSCVYFRDCPHLPLLWFMSWGIWVAFLFDESRLGGLLEDITCTPPVSEYSIRLILLQSKTSSKYIWMIGPQEQPVPFYKVIQTMLLTKIE